jgi:hypothetical protein
VKLPQHLLLLYCCAAEKFDHRRSLFTVFSDKGSLCSSFVRRERAPSKIINFVKTQEIQHQMARVRSTARVTHDGEETEATPDEGAPASEAEQADIKEGDTGEEEIDYNTAMPSKPSHLDFGKSTVSEADMTMMTKLGYFREADKGLIRFGGE